MLLTQIENLTDAKTIPDISMELEKRYTGTLLHLKTPHGDGFLMFDHMSGGDLYFTDTKNNISHSVFIQNMSGIEIEIPKLKKGFYLHKQNKDIHVSYVTKKAFRQWKRSICKSTYTLESVTEYIPQNIIFSKIAQTLHFMNTMVAILENELTNSKTLKDSLYNINLKQHFVKNNFLLLSNDFLLIRSLHTLDTFDLLYHKTWVGHTVDLENLIITDLVFKQEIYDLINSTNIPLRIQNG